MPSNRTSSDRLPNSGDWYEFPSWYDILHASGTAAEVTGLQRIQTRFGPTPPRNPAAGPTWLEPACGSGRYLRVAASRGIRVMGFDRSAAMVEYARATLARRNLGGDIVRADLQDFRTRWQADFAFCLINTIRHLPTDADYLAHLECMRRVLRPGCVYAVGIDLVRYGEAEATEDVWEGSRGRCRVSQMVQYLPPDRRDRVETVISHLMITTPSRRHHIDTVYPLRTFNRRQWANLIGRSAFAIVDVCDEQGRDLPVGWDDGFDRGYAIFILAPRS